MQNILRDDIEYIVHTEPDGTVIGPISKVHAHYPGVRSTLTHYSTWSMIFHPESGTYGIQLKNPKKGDALTDGKWDMGVAGYNCYIKDGSAWRYTNFEETLVKEAGEEIGLQLTVFDSLEEFLKNIGHTNAAYFFDRFLWRTNQDNEYVGLAFVTVVEQKTIFVDDEVVDFKWMLPEELKEFLQTGTNYCAALSVIFEKAEQFRLTALNEV
ncbi:MAG: NUDIX domain-containing protein [Patescibacteria group bacterium]|jgi:isopentenyldiphosphate isomerase